MSVIIHPELATLVEKPPTGNDWLHEVKYDGYRMICFIENKKIRWVSRNQIEYSDKLIHLSDAIKKLNIKTAILDGELVAINKNKKFDFQLLQNSITLNISATLVYYAFDIIYYEKRKLSHLPLLERKNILKKLISMKKTNAIQYSDHIIGNGDMIFKKSCEIGLEGIVSKNIHSFYKQKRTRDWLKVKCKQRQEFIICGFTPPQGSRKSFGALLLGVYEKEKLKYCGNVGTGFSDKTLLSLKKLFKKYLTDQKPFDVSPQIKNVSWLKPKLVGEVEFTEWTKDGALRHPSFKGLRDDKSAKEIIRETPD